MSDDKARRKLKRDLDTAHKLDYNQARKAREKAKKLKKQLKKDKKKAA